MIIYIQYIIYIHIISGRPYWGVLKYFLKYLSQDTFWKDTKLHYEFVWRAYYSMRDGDHAPLPLYVKKS